MNPPGRRSRVDGSGLDLRTRLLLVQGVRIGLTAVVAGAAVLDPDRHRGSAGSAVLAVATVYALVTTGAEWIRRRRRVRSLAAVHGLLMVDVVLSTLALGVAAPPGGALTFVPVVHAVVVSGALSARAGLVVAVGHGLALFAALVDRTAAGADVDATPYAAVATAVLVVTAASTLVDLVRDRTIRRDLDELDTLADLARRCDLDGTVDGIAEILRSTVGGIEGFTSAEVTIEPERTAPSDPGARSARLVRSRAGDAPGHEPGGGANTVVVPLVAGGLDYGTAEFGWSGGTHIPARSVELVEQLCAQASLAINNASLRDRIAVLAAKDQLTGLPNRRTFDDRLVAELGRWARTGEPVALAIVDVDHFKAVNDGHGHAVGDAVLAHLGAKLAAGIRTMDMAARFGGEEFAVILPSTSASAAVEVAERIRTDLGDGTGPIPFTVSIGVAVVPDDGSSGPELFEAADAALYRAKRGGRNQVCAASSTPRRGRPLRAGTV